MTFIEAVQAEMQRRGMGQHALAVEVGLPASTVRNWFRAQPNKPTLGAAEQVAAALDLEFAGPGGWRRRTHAGEESQKCDTSST